MIFKKASYDPFKMILFLYFKYIFYINIGLF